MLQTQGEDLATKWKTSTSYGQCALQRGEWQKAHGWFEQALQEAERIGENLLIATSLNNLGVCLRNMGDYGTARLALERAISLEPRDGEWLDFRTILRNNLAVLLHRAGAMALARRYYNESLHEIPSGEDPFGPWLGPMYNLALLNLHQGKTVQAESLLKRTRQLAERDWGEDHPYRGMLHLAFGLVALEQQRLQRAETQFYKALQCFDEDAPDDALLASRTRIGLAQVYLKQSAQVGQLGTSNSLIGEKQREAEGLFEDALRVISDLKSTSCPEYLEASSAYCDYLIACGRWADAEHWLNRLVDGVQRLYGMEHPLIVSALERVTVVLRGRQNFRDIPQIEKVIGQLRHYLKAREQE